MAVQELPLNCIAFDCGNSSLRTLVGQFDGEKITTKVVSQIPNAPIELNGLYYWDIPYIFEGLKQGLREAITQFKKIDSIGVCTWGVDFGLLDKDGNIVSNPLSMRNTIGEEELSKLSSAERRWMFEKTGIQNNRINSIYQLSGLKRVMPDIFSISKTLLLMPDLLVYLFTGEKSTECSIASTTQMLDVNSREYSSQVLQKFEVDIHLLKPIKQHGEVLGYLRVSLAEELGIDPCPVICVPSHDTACAVTSVPTDEEHFIFISSGTWSLIGTELKAPLINESVYERDFANEGGVFNSITLLKNSTGMHILQGIKKDLARSGKELSWEEIVEMARQYGGHRCVFDPNSFELFNPKSMIAAIQGLMTACDHTPEQVIASAYASLAYSYRHAIEQLQEITGTDYKSIFIVGGGSQNAYLNQLTANITGKRVIAGPKEATSLGNIGVQLVYHLNGMDLQGIRKLVRLSEVISSYDPEPASGRDVDDLHFSTDLALTA